LLGAGYWMLDAGCWLLTPSATLVLLVTPLPLRVLSPGRRRERRRGTIEEGWLRGVLPGCVVTQADGFV
jgi:hypothetical protein